MGTHTHTYPRTRTQTSIHTYAGIMHLVYSLAVSFQYLPSGNTCVYRCHAGSAMLRAEGRTNFPFPENRPSHRACLLFYNEAKSEQQSSRLMRADIYGNRRSQRTLGALGFDPLLPVPYQDWEEQHTAARSAPGCLYFLPTAGELPAGRDSFVLFSCPAVASLLVAPKPALIRSKWGRGG